MRGFMQSKVDQGLCKSALIKGAAGVRWSSYGENPHLRDFFKVLSLSADRDERIYISTIEAHKVMLITRLCIIDIIPRVVSVVMSLFTFVVNVELK